MKDDEKRERFMADVHRKRERIERGRREEDPSFWNYLGLMGAVGWSIALPPALGILIGRVLDRKFESGAVWTVFLMLVGLGIGCYSTWRFLREK